MNNAKLDIQINDYDTYQSTPSKLDQLCWQVLQVPIIRIFGSLSLPNTSYNILIHVHNYYPYLYIDNFDTEESLLESEEYIKEVINYLEYSLADSFKRRRRTEDENEEEIAVEKGVKDDSKTSKRKYIANVSICKGLPIYGYHLGYKLFYKISLLSPLYKTRLLRLMNENEISFNHLRLKNGLRSTNSKFNIYEGHIPYLMQFLSDFNLFGCGWIELNDCYFRSPIFSKNIFDNLKDLQDFLKPFINSHNVLNITDFSRIGKSLLEVDIRTSNIINRERLIQRNLHNDFVELKEFKSNITRNEIYLASLNHIYKDLKFQCVSRNSNLIDSQSLSTSILGIGETEWSNQLELNNLLDYIIKLNKSTGLNFEAYSVKFAKKEWKFPTCFELVDIEKFQNHKVKLNFFKDLIKWKNYNSLFEHKDVHIPTPNGIPIDVSFNSDFSDDEIDEPGEAAIQEVMEDEYNKSGNDNDIEEGQEHQSITEENVFVDDTSEEGSDSEIDEANLIETQSRQLDESLIFELTQRKSKKRLFSQIVEDEPSSVLEIPSSFNESCNDSFNLSKNEMMDYIPGNNAYEVLVPQHLHKDRIINLFDDLGILRIDYVDPFYDNESDLPNKPLIFANKKIIVPCINAKSVEPLPMSKKIKQELPSRRPKVHVSKFNLWQYAIDPPSKSEVDHWVQVEELRMKNVNSKFKSQIEPPITNEYKLSYNSEKVNRNPDNFINLTCFHLEIHANTFNELLPNPNKDPISTVFYNFDDSNNMFHNITFKSGILMTNNLDCDENKFKNMSNYLSGNISIEVFDDELQMIKRLIDLIEFFDPDVLSGYEINALSWGYIIERFLNFYDINLLPQLSRCNFKSNGKFGDRWGYTHTSAIKINGRHLLNIWRLLRSELSLTSYSLENISYHLLHQSLPKYSNLKLSEWFSSSQFQEPLLFFKYYLKRIELVLKIIKVQELITRNVEYSRLIGIDFNSIFYRGSQFKVESILSRISKSENLLLNSPSKKDVHQMRSLGCLPLIMEPESNFYKSPLVVLDFQSLYPSVIIAYNYCYSTLLGKLNNFWPNKNNIGYLKNLNLPPGLIDLFNKENGINLSPNGFMFVKSSIRKSILAKMLEEILNTRIKVKSVMKLFKDDSELIKLFNSRQLALKLIANVTYGYASATFSGRMPNTDIADAVVSTGREILVKSIELIENSNYGAKVVYGDTDSLFVYFPGKSKSEAFKYGNEIANFITSQFPDPIKLKFEKVYHPCVLLSKKRYVGYSYEFEDQIKPKFDAKGIETIRRDGIPAQQKMVEKTLRILFETKNLSVVKNYTIKQFFKILVNKISVNDFCFAKEVRHGTYKNEMYLPPGAIVANKQISKDPRKEPQFRERVPYVIIQDATKPRIKDRCISPEEFIESYNTPNPFILDYEYYITRVLIPPLERIFNLIGVNIKSWYKELPKPNKNNFNAKDILNISNFIKSNSCLSCGLSLEHQNASSKHICNNCLKDELSLITTLSMDYKKNELKLLAIEEVCEKCISRNIDCLGSNGIMKNCSSNCTNNDCSVYFTKFKAKNERSQLIEKKSHVFNDLNW